ncbi:helix-turn-helix domain-containing protein [Bradyrhizobium sp. CCBAU 53338]|uniref:helix-turn-helix domain-containing protein n=1 Tax=Bradyrhizobium sp. CCBAU 53338 TaxID=1325111 RepID=UPI00352EE670
MIDTGSILQAAPVLPPKDAARYLGVSVKTLLAFVRDGELKYIHLGRGRKKIRRGFDLQDIEEFKQSRTRRDMPCQFTGTTSAASTISTSRSKVIGFTARRELRMSEKRRPSSV